MGCANSTPDPPASVVVAAPAAAPAAAAAAAAAIVVRAASSDGDAKKGGGSGGPEEDEKEPMLLLDVTGSMQLGTSKDDPTPRCDTVKEAIRLIVDELAKKDSQAEKEEGGGGLLTITFAGGEAKELGDLNPKNLKEKWEKIEWSGRTVVMPGWLKVKETFMEEFGKRPPESRPTLLCLIITDGDAEDTDTFAATMAKEAAENVFVGLAIIGFGDEHDRAIAAYQRIAAQNKHVRVIPFGSETDPRKISRELMKLIE